MELVEKEIRKDQEDTPCPDSTLSTRKLTLHSFLENREAILDIASRKLSQEQIIKWIKRWFPEHNSRFVANALENPQSTLRDIIDVVTQYRFTTQEGLKEKPVEEYWQWRTHMAQSLGADLDGKRFGVQGLYLFGSVKNATAGPASDIDLLIHFVGSEAQKRDLLSWLEGWSLSLARINYLRTGYKTQGLLDIHLVTDEDIKRRTSFALKIGAITDPALPLVIGNPLED